MIGKLPGSENESEPQNIEPQNAECRNDPALVLLLRFTFAIVKERKYYVNSDGALSTQR
jgi:hypothetical protein